MIVNPPSKPDGSLAFVNSTGRLTMPSLQMLQGMWQGIVFGITSLNVGLFGAKGDGVTDDTAAIQAALNAAAAVSGGRGTIFIPYGSYPISSTLAWPKNVNITADFGARIFATVPMAALLETGIGANAITNCSLSGGRWDGNYLAQRGIWIREGYRCNIETRIFSIGPYVDGASETESSYIRIGDPGQSATPYEIFIHDSRFARAYDATAASLAPANNYGVFSDDGASDCHVVDTVIEGAKVGCQGEFAAWKFARVHVWSALATEGPLAYGFYSTKFQCDFEQCQVDVPQCDTTVAVRIAALVGNPIRVYTINQLSVTVTGGTDNTGNAITIDSGAKLTFTNSRIQCNSAAHRYAIDVSGDLSGLISSGNRTVNVVQTVAAYAGIRLLAQSAVGVSAPADVTEDILATVTIPANVMGVNGRLRITTLWTVTSSANNKIMRVRFGGIGGTVYMQLTQTAIKTVRDQREIANRGSASSQVGADSSFYSAAGWGTATADINTSAVDTTADVDLVITGEKANAGETLRLESYLVELIN